VGFNQGALIILVSFGCAIFARGGACAPYWKTLA
jgi:hypothetical protein